MRLGPLKIGYMEVRFGLSVAVASGFAIAAFSDAAGQGFSTWQIVFAVGAGFIAGFVKSLFFPA